MKMKLVSIRINDFNNKFSSNKNMDIFPLKCIETKLMVQNDCLSKVMEKNAC